ncbi:MAG TPA: ferredoxin [Jatrophihabitans sp.]|nr:ferredoxin [Jatrophihabitans sp.]
MAARLQIDWTRCDGHGLCAALLPDSIGRDDWGYPVLDERRLAGEPVAAVKRAVACCPALALRLERVPART